jgi:hypothetical protein
VTPEAITTRNRANAAKSTGPRSTAGKAAVAQNARRHGATARPDRERVAIWARIILDTPDLGPTDLLTDDIRIQCALVLASAEARFAGATRALEDFEAGAAPPADAEETLRSDIGQVLNAFAGQPISKAERDEALDLIARMQKETTETAQAHDRRHRLLKRYWREARAQRKRAFRDWLACLRAPAPAHPSPGKTHKIPKQSQIST